MATNVEPERGGEGGGASGAAGDHGAAVRAPDPLKTLSDELTALAATFSEHKVTLGEVMDRLGARASGLLVVILALPFCAPITIPGLSVPFGVVIAFIAARYALGLAPWLPARLRATVLPPKFFGRVIAIAGRFLGAIERRLKPRWDWLAGTPARRRFHGWMVFAGALMLLLPLGGIPFTNTLPALAVVIGMMGIMERDGAAIAVGHGLLAATIAYFATFAAVIVELVQRAWHWVVG